MGGGGGVGGGKKGVLVRVSCFSLFLFGHLTFSRVMHHQLLKGICSDGRIKALKEIRYEFCMHRCVDILQKDCLCS